MRGKTIQIYLLDGNPKGVQHISSPGGKVVQAYYIPRDEISNPKIVKKEELKQPAIYFLYTEDKELAYIGQTENALHRIKQHNAKKDFWDSALVFIASDSTITTADVKYLEYKAITRAQDCNRVTIEENKVTPSKPKLPDSRVDMLEEFFEDIILLSSFLHIDWFEEKQKDTDIKPSEIFYLKVRGIEAKGVYNKKIKKFTLLEGSQFIKNEVPSISNFAKNRRQEVLAKSDMVEETENYYILKESQEFKSPTGAALFCLGGSSNTGWEMWKNEKGQTLDEVYRNGESE